MDHVTVVHGAVVGALVESCLLHVRADGGRGGGEVAEDFVERGGRVPGGKGNKFHPSLIFPKGRDEGGVFFGLLCHLVVAVGFFAQSDLDEGEGAMCLAC